ncbi:MAG: patatin-like phospholipase family protein [Hyphomonadaceae bacterium]|nr:patatin-like phospholipase family protein [Hyphomonadaceae bacterium]
MSVAEISAFYKLVLPRLFRRARSLGIFGSRFDNRPLRDALNEAFADETLKSEKLRTGLALFAKRLDTGMPWALTNNPGWYYFQSITPDPTYLSNADLRLRKLVQASAAAPHYFDPVSKIGKHKAVLVDGAVAGLNNPALELVMIASDPAYGFGWRLSAENIYLMSVGTGLIRQRSKAAIYAGLTIDSLRGVINDVGLQQVAYLQALSECPLKWWINSEKKDQFAAPYCPAPLLHYQRCDVRLENAHEFSDEGSEFKASSLLQRRLSDRELRSIADMSSVGQGNLDLLEQLGHRAGTIYVAKAPPPVRFDPR